MSELTRHNNTSFECLFEEEKYTVYALLFYLAGLILGSFSFKLYNSDAVIKLLGKIYTLHSDSVLNVFLSNFAVYISLFITAVFLGLFLIGYPVINLIPFAAGTVISVKISYYFTQFGAKGIGYSLLMLIPEVSALLTIILYTTNTSSQISKFIQKCATGNAENLPLKIKPLLKRYIIYAVAVTLIALINALLTYLIGGIIRI